MFLFYEINFYNFAVSPLTDYKTWLLETDTSTIGHHLSETDPASPGHESLERMPLGMAA